MGFIIVIRSNFKVNKMRSVRVFLFGIVINSLLLFSLIASDAVILVTSDIHGNVSSGKGGFLQLSSAIKSEEGTEGRENVILIDCGDTLQGSFEASVTKGAMAINLLNELGYDFWIPGNHDFDYGFDVFLDRAKDFRGRTLCSNIALASGSKIILPYAKWSMVKKNNIKIAIIGATFPDINSSWVISPDAPFRTIALSAALQTIMPKVLKDNPDVIVLALHGGLFNKNWSLGKEIQKYPQIDLVLGAHTHEAIAGKALYNGAYYFQSGHGGEYLGKIEITMNKEKGRPDFVSKLIPVANYPADKQVLDKLSKTLDSIRKDGQRQIAFINPDQAQSSGFLISKAIAFATKADVAIFGLSPNNEKLSGTITNAKLHDLIPYEDNVALMKVTKDELKVILQNLNKHMKSNKKYKKLSSYGFRFSVSKNGKVLNVILPPALENKNRMLLAISSYYIDYPTNKFPGIRKIAEENAAEYKNTNQTVRDVLKAYLQIKFPLKN